MRSARRPAVAKTTNATANVSEVGENRNTCIFGSRRRTPIWLRIRNIRPQVARFASYGQFPATAGWL